MFFDVTKAKGEKRFSLRPIRCLSHNPRFGGAVPCLYTKGTNRLQVIKWLEMSETPERKAAHGVEYFAFPESGDVKSEKGQY